MTSLSYRGINWSNVPRKTCNGIKQTASKCNSKGCFARRNFRKYVGCCSPEKKACCNYIKRLEETQERGARRHLVRLWYLMMLLIRKCCFDLLILLMLVLIFHRFSLNLLRNDSFNFRFIFFCLQISLVFLWSLLSSSSSSSLFSAVVLRSVFTPLLQSL